MVVTFQINYHTVWGESLFIEFQTPERCVFPMEYRGDGIWLATINADDFKSASYSYFVRRADGSERREWGGPRFIDSGKMKSLHVFDRWHDRSEESPFYSSAFTECFFKRKNSQPIKRGTFTLYVEAPTIDASCKLEICGSIDAVGNWNTDNAVILDDSKYPLFVFSADIPSGTEFEFKLIVRDEKGNAVWEDGNNRHIRVPQVEAEGSQVEIAPFADPRPHWKCAGTAIPVFSLRSENDGGIGDFYDLKLMADWAKQTGQRIIQILPVNDTTMSYTWKDSYPYNAISIFALHPAYLRVDAVGELPEAEKKEFDAGMQRAASSAVVCYEEVIRLKLKAMESLFEIYGDLHLASAEFKDFYVRNERWLRPYSAFCVLRDKIGTCDIGQWGDYAIYSPSKVDILEKEESSRMRFCYFIQYHLDKQLREVRDYCHSKGICLKGDIPIGISRTSADAWENPSLFNLDVCAGAPPDDFAVLGQNWGFPTYNWDEMAKDDFGWWKDRFVKMADYFDAYRIDHLLGFFRIWEIPGCMLHGLSGTFNPALAIGAEEMRSRFNFNFDRALYTRPYITDQVLNDVFGGKCSEVRTKFLKAPIDGYYSFKDEFGCQRDIVKYFASLDEGEKDTDMCEGILRLMDDVLFIEDTRNPEKYHPRITPRRSFVYESLSEEQRIAFDGLYEDFYYSRSVELWKEKALWKLPALIDSTGMLCCGEDLGMIPSCVPEVMDALRIFSLKVQRMSGEFGEEFADTSVYPYYSVCTTSTHDMSGIRGWWEEDSLRSGRYFEQMLSGKGDAPKSATEWICEEIVKSHLDSPSMLCILPLQDWLSTDKELRRENPSEEQINEPSNSDNNWNYRMHLTLESLLSADSFNERLRWLIGRSGR